jgi:glycosyltransferase involved in cell wall biosynthesis
LASIERFVVVDDASTDNTRQVVTAACVNGPRFELWESEQNAGERVVVNRSFKRFMEEGITWCIVLHADDVAKHNWLQLLLTRIHCASSSTVSICSSWDDWYDDRTVGGEDDPSKADVVFEGNVTSVKQTLSKGCWWHFSGCAMNLTRFFDVGSFCEDMPQLGDLEWLIRSQLKGMDIVYIPRTLIRYRQTQTNVSSISFRTNRDLREAWLIATRHSTTSQIRPAIKSYARMNFKRAIRRAITSTVRGNLTRGFSAFSCACKLLSQV